jgi:tRNA A37 N6-isopentenylltransferase MiaA
VKPPRREIEHYMGSIVIAPDRGDCRQRIDNRTGKMWDKGYVNCYEAITAQERDQRVGMSSAWINAIGKVFNHAGDN